MTANQISSKAWPFNERDDKIAVCKYNKQCTTYNGSQKGLYENITILNVSIDTKHEQYVNMMLQPSPLFQLEMAINCMHKHVFVVLQKCW